MIIHFPALHLINEPPILMKEATDKNKPVYQFRSKQDNSAFKTHLSRLRGWILATFVFFMYNK